MVDKFPHKNDLTNIYLADFIQSQITLWKQFDFNRKFEASIGSGITHFRVLPEDIYESDENLYYFNARLNVHHRVFLKNLYLNVGSSLYCRTKKIDPYGTFNNQFFLNLDFGLSYKFKEKFELTVSSPFSIYPMYSGYFFNHEISNQPLPFFGETTGFNLGLSYTFYQKKKK